MGLSEELRRSHVVRSLKELEAPIIQLPPTFAIAAGRLVCLQQYNVTV